VAVAAFTFIGVWNDFLGPLAPTCYWALATRRGLSGARHAGGRRRQRPRGQGRPRLLGTLGALEWDSSTDSWGGESTSPLLYWSTRASSTRNTAARTWLGATPWYCYGYDRHDACHAGALYGTPSRVWGVTRIGLNTVRLTKHDQESHN